MILTLAIFAGVAMAALLFKVFFDDLAEFLECLRFWFTPEIISVFRGEWNEDLWAELKLFVYVGLSTGVGFLANYSLHKWLD